jgi:hypothetical protein
MQYNLVETLDLELVPECYSVAALHINFKVII